MNVESIARRISGHVPEAEQRRYLKMNMGSEDGAPGVTLYEVDGDGRVIRFVQVYDGGSRFTPDDIIMCRTVNADYIASHSIGEEVDMCEFESMWKEVCDGRRFCERIPDPSKICDGWMWHRGEWLALRWDPCGEKPLCDGWLRVPGFTRLFAKTSDEKVAWGVHRSVFLERDISWGSS